MKTVHFKSSLFFYSLLVLLLLSSIWGLIRFYVEEYYAIIGVIINVFLFYVIFTKNKNVKSFLIVYFLLYFIPSFLKLLAVSWKYFVLDDMNYSINDIDKSLIYLAGSVLFIFLSNKLIVIKKE